MYNFDKAAQVLGPERCDSALRAFDDPDAQQSWDRCVLARAFGPFGALTRAIHEIGTYKTTERGTTALHVSSDQVGGLLGLDGADVIAIIDAFDKGRDRDALRTALTTEAAKAHVMATVP